MTTIFTHAIVAAAIGTAFKRSDIPRSLWVAGALCSMAPDVDVIGLGLGIQYGDYWGHRGFTHSILFAIIVSLTFTFAVFWRRPHKRMIASYLFLSTVSHGVIDALTNGGLGIAFFSPIDDSRYFLPWQPIEVCAIGPGFFSAEGIHVLVSEMIWVWMPCILFASACLFTHWKLSANTRTISDDRAA